MITQTRLVLASDLRFGDVYHYPCQSTFRRIVSKPVSTISGNVEFQVQEVTSGHHYSVSLDNRFKVALVNSDVLTAK